MFDHEKLQRRRLALNLRPKDIYLILGISAATYSSWESGAHDPDESEIRKLELIFDVERDYFIDKTHIIGVFPKLTEKNKKLVQDYAYQLYLKQEEAETLKP
ncbi:helix-turn-helix domain-containing protein [Streptococcus oricebi]|uniref:XRE family transcriptional regulator n=1 Tax=Streptococcus oricebi TaxID=1547447 RepID=A0ABS5B2I5_9STRE|nr:helix-turn-helix transcriptional regulator [Streptococcus oricebi]MBP2623040.1 XRE family transcriptional regulator [Streptococcus oricebi]